MTITQNLVMGIDFGAKRSGKTVIAFNFDHFLHFRQCKTGKDADQFLMTELKSLKPICIAIDAPLTLPRAYFGEGHDYMYRHADRQLAGMSPMFLGGLTARAVAIKNWALGEGIDVIEAYPAAFLKKRFPDLLPFYKQNLAKCIKTILENFAVDLKQNPSNWHQFDAWICWIIATLYRQELARSAGDPSEGIIYY